MKQLTRGAVLIMITSIIAVAGTAMLRGLIGVDRVWLHDLALWLHAMALLVGCALATARGRHVRVDVFFSRLNPAHRKLVDRLGTLLLLAPATLILLFYAAPYAVRSVQSLEASPNADGLPGLFVVKVGMVVALALILPFGIGFAWRRDACDEQAD